MTWRRSLEPALVGLALVAPAFAWTAVDRSVWPWDPAWYGEVSLDLYSSLRLDTHWIGSMLDAFGQKAPGVAWVGQLFVPLGVVVGSDLRALLLSIVLTQAATVAVVYATARRAVPSESLPAIAAALLLASAPLFVGLSHQYFSEPLQGLAVAWMIFAMVSAAQWRPALTLVHVMGATALGLIAKISTPAYSWAPALVALAIAMHEAHRGKETRRPWYGDHSVLRLAALVAPLVLGAVAWYQRNARAAIDHARSSAGSELYGGRGSFGAKLGRWLEHWHDALLTSYFDIAVAVLTVALAIVAALRLRHRPRPRLGRSSLYAAACAASILFLLMLFARSANEDVRFLLAALPHASLLLAVALGAAGARRVTAATVAVLALHIIAVNARGFGLGERPPYPYLVPPERDDEFAKRLQSLVRATCNENSNGKINVVGGDYPWLNANTMSLLADVEFTTSRRECAYTALGYVETDAEAAWERVRALAAPFYISLDYGNRSNRLPPTLMARLPAYAAFNEVNEAVFWRALNSGEYQPIPSTRLDGVVALRRTT